MKTGRHLSLTAVLLSCLGLSACDPIALTVMGAGASAGVSYGLDSVAYKTFTAPMGRVDRATVAALKRMGIKIVSVEKTPGGKVFNASSYDRVIEVTLEAVSKKATRIRSIALQDNIFFDKATANEIVNQTEKVLRRRG